MASKQTYVCFTCRKNGFDNVQVYLDGKDEQGKTKYLNGEMTPHQHKQQQPQTQQQQAKHPETQQSQQQTEPSLEKVSDESVERRINAFSMVSELLVLVEKNQKQLVTLNE